MMKRRAGRSHPAHILLSAFLALFILTAVAATAQEAPKQQPADSNKKSAEGNSASDQPSGMSAESAKESREAAGEEKGENDAFKKSPSVRFLARITGLSLQHAYWLAVLLNFAVIAGVIIWLSRTRLPGLFRNRTASIQKAIAEAHRASREANQRLAQIEARLARLDVEIGTMHAAADKEAEAEESRIKAAAEEDAHKIIQAAEQEIAAATKSARRDLKAYAADLAVSLAQKQIQVDSATDQALVRNFAGQLPASDTDGGRGKAGR